MLGPCPVSLVVAPAQFLRASSLICPRPGRIWCCAPRGSNRAAGASCTRLRKRRIPAAALRSFPAPPLRMRSPSGMPTAVTLAATDAELAQRLAALIARPTFRPYVSTDVAGAEIGGAVKNVLAIACGVVEGAGLGQNARAALIARGFAEMTRFGLAKGARAETLSGLSGLGDLVLTCSSTAVAQFLARQGAGGGQERGGPALQPRHGGRRGLNRARAARRSAQRRALKCRLWKPSARCWKGRRA
jgi:glycerol-3-phosphate dehydrogenase (NAD(P)+)